MSDSEVSNNGSSGVIAGPDAWLTPARFALLLGGLIAATYPEVLLGVSTFFFRDYGLFGYPLAYYHRASFWQGQIPLWNPFSNCGLPFLAQWNTMVLYPGSLFYLLLPLSWSLAVFCLIHQFWAGLGMFFWARQWTLSPRASALAGVVFAFNGLTSNCLVWPNYIAALSWMPWVFFWAERAMQTGGGAIIAASLAGAMQMLAGGVDFTAFTWLWLAALCVGGGGLESPRTGNRRRRAGRLLLVGGIVLGLTAAQWIPFADLVAHSQRHSGFANDSGSMPGTGWANFFVPLFQCMPTNQGVFFQQTQGWTTSYYAGVAVMVLAGLGFWRSPDKRARWLGTIALLGLVLALGDAGYLYHWLRTLIPQFGFLRYPIKFITLTVVALAPLAALGFEVWDGNFRGRSSIAVTGRIWVLLMACALGVILTAVYSARFPMPLENPGVVKQNAMARLALFAIILVLLYSHTIAKDARKHSLLFLLLVVAFWLDFRWHVPQQNPSASRTLYDTPMDRPNGLQMTQQDKRLLLGRDVYPRFDRLFFMEGIATPHLYPLYRMVFYGNCNLLEGVSKTDGFFALYLREEDEARSLMNATPGDYPPGWLDFLGVTRLVTMVPELGGRPRPTAMPLYSVGQRPRFADRRETLEILFSTNFQPRQEVFLPLTAREKISAGQDPTAHVSELKRSAHRIELETEATRASLLVLSQAFYHPWQAYVDGSKAPLWRANYAFQALEVPAGRHRVMVRYEDRGFETGVWVSALTLVGCGIGWHGRYRRSRSHGSL